MNPYKFVYSLITYQLYIIRLFLMANLTMSYILYELLETDSHPYINVLALSLRNIILMHPFSGWFKTWNKLAKLPDAIFTI